MASENVIRNAVKLEVAEDDWVFWNAPKAMFQSSDIFGIFDCIIAKRGCFNKIRFIQYTSKSNMGARRRKIRKWMEINRIFIPSELWGYDRGKFIKEDIANPFLES